MADTGILCILTEDDDMEARAARACPEVLVLGCPCHADCQHCAVLSCVRDAHGEDEPHRDIDRVEWKVTAGD